MEEFVVYETIQGYSDEAVWLEGWWRGAAVILRGRS
jgi:hypothetical protein